jgi:hypothetical protein
LPRVVLGTLYLNFADGTYTVTATILLSNFKGGTICVQGNMTEALALHTNQAVIFDGSAFDGQVMYFDTCDSYVCVFNIAQKVNTTSNGRLGIYMSVVSRGYVEGCCIIGTSNTQGFCFYGQGGFYRWDYNYCSNTLFGFCVVEGIALSIGNDDTGTPPKYGLYCAGGMINRASTQPSGSVADVLRANGGFVGPLSEDDLTFSNVATLNVSTSMHGLVPIAPSNTGQFLRGDGAWGNVRQVGTLPVYANNTGAISGGLATGFLYRTSGNPDPVCVVH